MARAIAAHVVRPARNLRRGAELVHTSGAVRTVGSGHASIRPPAFEAEDLRPFAAARARQAGTPGRFGCAEVAAFCIRLPHSAHQPREILRNGSILSPRPESGVSETHH